MKRTNKLRLNNKEISWISKDIHDKCDPFGFVNTYEAFPRSRFGTDTAVLFNCKNVDTNKLKREIVSHGETDIIVGLTTKSSRERIYPKLLKLNI